MVAAGAGVILAVILRVIIICALVLGGAYALTTYVDLPGFVDALVWLGAGGYALLNLIGLFSVLATLVAAGRRL